jgi:hypothetical protein
VAGTDYDHGRPRDNSLQENLYPAAADVAISKLFRLQFEQGRIIVPVQFFRPPDNLGIKHTSTQAAEALTCFSDDHFTARLAGPRAFPGNQGCQHKRLPLVEQSGHPVINIHFQVYGFQFTVYALPAIHIPARFPFPGYNAMTTCGLQIVNRYPCDLPRFFSACC